MRSSSGGWLALGGLIVIAACSSASKPGALGDCTGDACAYGGSGGSGGGDDAGSDDGGACSVSSSLSQCDQCAGTDCCADLDSCGSSTACENVLSCAAECLTASCQMTCEQQVGGTGATLFEKLVSCLSTKCPVCAELGVGDPCGATTATCNAGLTCEGLWCSKLCTASSQC